MSPFPKKYRFLSLIVFAALAGIAWRIEVEYYGWKGLIWLSYYHLAIPFALCLFLIWANISIELKLMRRIGLSLVAILLAFIVVIALEQGFRRMFISGPAAFFYHFGEDPLRHLIYDPLYVIGLLPLSIALLSRLFGIVCKPLYVILGTVMMAVSPEICVFIMDLFGDKGSPDYLHTIKSGHLMTFWFFSIGLVFMRHSVKKSAVEQKLNLELVDSELE